MKKIFLKIARGSLPLLFTVLYSVTPAYSLTVNEVARELACPCECPLVLEDCNMSCGLGWKKDIGKKIKAGMTKDEIVKAFVAKHGVAAKITPLMRIHGKFFQYTRAFGPSEWIVFWSVIVVWTVSVFLGIYVLVRRVSRQKDRRESDG